MSALTVAFIGYGGLSCKYEKEIEHNDSTDWSYSWTRIINLSRLSH